MHAIYIRTTYGRYAHSITLAWIHTVVSHIYAPCFATLVLVESVGGAYMRDPDILSCEYAPSSGVTPRC